MNNVLLRGTRMSTAEIRDEVLHNSLARQKKMEPFYVSCEALGVSNLAEIWHSSAHEATLQVKPVMHFNFGGSVTSPRVGDLWSVTTGVKRSSRFLFIPHRNGGVEIYCANYSSHSILPGERFKQVPLGRFWISCGWAFIQWDQMTSDWWSRSTRGSVTNDTALILI